VRLIWGTVKELLASDGAQRTGYSELLVEIDGRDGTSRAINYPDITGSVSSSDRVLLNTTAVDLELGTGGKHFVVARIGGDTRDNNSAEGLSFEGSMDSSAGHLMKLRYSPHQHNVLSVESQESPFHKIMETRDSLEGVPVVCCGLHSQVPLVAAAVKRAMPTLMVGYVMDDAGSLSLNLSKVLADSVDAGLIDVTVSTGQSFGGQIEAINLHSGMLAAVHVGGCDVVITGIGPGLAGTGTPFGHGGVAQGEAINAAATLGGVPIACLRMSQADTRDRHLGISHHSLTALSRVALAPATIAVPHIEEDNPVFETVNAELDALPSMVEHMAFQLEEPYYDPEHMRGIEVITMGRSYEDDPIFFEAASAAGATAAMVAVMTIEEETAAAIEGAEGSQALASAGIISGKGEANGASSAGPCPSLPLNGSGCGQSSNCPSPCDNV